MNINIIDLKKTEYDRALEIQLGIQRRRIEGSCVDTLILVEHPAVLTMGKRGTQENVLAPQKLLEEQGIKTVWVNRGGDVTYHGPGQIVGYPIVHLTQSNLGIRVFVEKLQQTIIDYLDKEHGITAYSQSGVHTGVWVDEKKICALGISVSRNVTMHGFALNINTDLKHFDYINPCGLGAGKVTSLKEIVGHEINFEDAKKQIVKYFCSVFEATAVYSEVNETIEEL